MSQTIIYVPGLGDQSRLIMGVQRLLLALWRRRNTKLIIFCMYWKKPNFQQRFAGLQQLIAQESEQSTVCLVGVSAGASAVLSAYAEMPEKIGAVTSICGKINGRVADTFRRANPAFSDSYDLLQANLTRITPKLKKSTLTLYSPLDMVIASADATIPGVEKIVLPPLMHQFACAYALAFKQRAVRRFLLSKTD